MDLGISDTLSPEANPTIPDVIAPINRNTVHRICSGQVVLSLAIGVKELVENAIDASATNIEVRLKEYGSELVEVSDNGKGVHKEQFQALTLKHYTSKLREFSDLESVETLGFRGEALSSLCALSDLTITTRHASAEHATKIRYDQSGLIIDEAPAARETGTTVTLENLFSTLPVRRKEFTKNLKREYSKMCQLLYAYCLVSKGVKFMCSNQTKAGSRSTVVATEGSSSLRDNIISIYGARQLPSLVELPLVGPDEKILDEYKVKIVPGEALPFGFECLISSAKHGSGRSTADRQFFFINARPCEPSKVSKLVNEVYRQFNGNQYPFVVLNVRMERSLVDVNVTPDKRQIFLEKEKLLLAVLKSSLLEAFKNCPSTCQMQNLNLTDDQPKSSAKPMKSLKRSLDETKVKSEASIIGRSRALLELFKNNKRSKSDTTLPSRRPEDPPLNQSSLTENDNFKITVERRTSPDRNLDELVAFGRQLQNESELVIDSSFTIEADEPNSQIDVKSEAARASINGQFQSSIQPDVFERDEKPIRPRSPGGLSTEVEELEDSGRFEIEIEEPRVGDRPPKKSVTVRSSMKYIREALGSCRSVVKDETIQVKFRSEITPAANKTAEQELQKRLTKDMFKEMDVVGQFNLGFIITKLENDLFIVDQHATDEKYNFEQLQLTTVLESQVLVNPKRLELTAANEDLLIENEEVFRRNGFKFIINPTAPATKKVLLSAIPISKNYIFGKDDIDEMLFMLQEDANHAVCRPSRVRSMFASRACRKSVMVGCPLSQADMRRLVDHMGEIEQPWNCPHGRPTMRHLVNLKLIQNT